jgi:P pilus assembly chaperone PapD
VFWLNVLEIPPKAEASGANTNHLQLAFRSRIKMFYRPANLKGSALDAPGQVAWRLVASGNQFSLEARNPTSYHVSFTALEVKGSDGKVASFDDGGMVNPGETQVFPLKGDVTQSAAPKVHYTALNDHGGAVTGEAAATH